MNTRKKIATSHTLFAKGPLLNTLYLVLKFCRFCVFTVILSFAEGEAKNLLGLKTLWGGILRSPDQSGSLRMTKSAKLLLILNTTPAYAQVSGGDIEQHLGGGWPFSDLGRLMSSGVQMALIASGILVLAFIIYGGISYLVAAGDKELMTKSQRIITNAIAGMLVVVAAFAVTKIIEIVFGIRILSGIILPRP